MLGLAADFIDASAQSTSPPTDMSEFLLAAMRPGFDVHLVVLIQLRRPIRRH